MILSEKFWSQIKQYCQTHYPSTFISLRNFKNDCLLIRQLKPVILLNIFFSEWDAGSPQRVVQRMHAYQINSRFLRWEDWIVYLKNENIPFEQGGHTIYLAPQSVQKSVLSVLCQYYPFNFGIKILKNSIDKNKEMYFSKKLHAGFLQRALTYPPRQLVLVANVFYLWKLGPRLYDLIKIRCGNVEWLAYVVEHIESRRMEADEFVRGLGKLKRLTKRNVIAPINVCGYHHQDFSFPNLNQNALAQKTTGKFYYVDFQGFRFLNYKKLYERILKKANRFNGRNNIVHNSEAEFFCRLIKRKMFRPENVEMGASRLLCLKQLMGHAGFNLKKSIFINIQCGLGMLIAYSLCAGAHWCFGYDKDETISAAMRILLATGCTRFSLFPLSEGKVLDASLIRSIHFDAPLKHVIAFTDSTEGILKADFFNSMPWEFMIYENFSLKSQDELETRLQKFIAVAGAELCEKKYYDSSSKYSCLMAVLLRKN